MKTALLIPFHNRPEYLRKCLASLPPPPKGLTVILINDFSTDFEAIEIANNFTLKGSDVELHNMPRNVGIKSVLKYGFEYAFKNHDVVINLDSDCIVTPDFFTRILELRDSYPQIVSGFNSSNNKINPIIKTYPGHLLKKFANGACLCVGKSHYRNYIAPALSKPGNWDYSTSLLCKEVVVAKPSLVQHIGMVSSMGHSLNPDVAIDFPRIKLPDVTLFGIDAHDPAGITRASEICQRHIEFGDVKIITERLFKGREGYSKFCIKEMAKYINTSHVLLVHADGYVVNPWRWDESWLQYDYIGATWAYKDNMNVGNGGFSLRSKKLLDLISQCKIKELHPEDCVICRQMRPFLEAQGMKFAPEDVANRFSIEAYGSSVFTDSSGIQAHRYSGQFGFHSYGILGLPIPPLPKKR